MFKTHYNAREFDKKYEKDFPKSVTEQFGMVSVKDRVESMLQAGMRLDAYRASQYDIPADSDVNDDDVAIDPTRKDFDLADATALSRDLDTKFKEVKDAASKKKKISIDTNDGSQSVAATDTDKKS